MVLLAYSRVSGISLPRIIDDDLDLYDLVKRLGGSVAALAR